MKRRRAFASRDYPPERPGRCIAAEIERKGATLSKLASQPDLASEQRGEFPRYGQSKACASVFSRGSGVRLLKGLEDKTLLFRRDADAGVVDSQREHLFRATKARIVGTPAVLDQADLHVDLSARGELKGI